MRLCRYVKTPELWASLAVPWCVFERCDARITNRLYRVVHRCTLNFVPKPISKGTIVSICGYIIFLQVFWAQASWFGLLDSRKITPPLPPLLDCRGHGYSPESSWYGGNRSLMASLCSASFGDPTVWDCMECFCTSQKEEHNLSCQFGVQFCN